MVARRKERSTSPSRTKPSSQDRPSSHSTGTLVAEATTIPKWSHPLLPTPLETALIAIYPLTLLLGSLFAHFSYSIRSTKSTYNPVHQSFQPPSSAPSYFARKNNVFNIYFVKIGWFWSTLALLLFLFTHHTLGAPFSVTLTERRLRALVRWSAVTAVWFFTTQWAFGPPLIDRSFKLTGGACELAAAAEGGDVHLSRARKIATNAECKIAGGTWSGGVDISGHVFLLVIGSTMLWMEVLPAVMRSRGLREERTILHSDGRIGPASEDSKSEREKRDSVTVLGVKVVVGVVALSLWMLLMTAAFFHTWVEKLSGLVVAFAGIWLVYFLPRAIPSVRSLLGMPAL